MKKSGPGTARLAPIFLLILFLPASFIAAETPIPPPPAHFVTDTVGFMTPDAAAALDARLEAYDRQTGHQLLVWIGPTTGGPAIEDWAVRAFEKWKVGRKGIDDGVVLFVMTQDRRLRFEVGYGLEGDVPDIIASRVINDIITPGFRANNPSASITAGMEAIAQAIGMPLPGGSSQAPIFRGRDTEPQPPSLIQLIVGAIFVLIVLGFVATNPTLALWLLANLMAGGHRHGRSGWGGGGGFGGGGGGFSGGGGRSGGGGASGSW